MTKNYTITHSHSMLSNCTTNVDSVTSSLDYIKRAKELGMKSIAFTEHGNVLNWYLKKKQCEEHGLKYIHAVEMYLTEDLNDRKRDNYHIGLYARNYEGVLELNTLVSRANNRLSGTNHFFYTPRISFDELLGTSDNIMVTTACIGGILYKGTEELQERYLKFLQANSHRCFLEIQHHKDEVQAEYNKKLLNLSQEYGIRLIGATDTHSLNLQHSRGRTLLQKAKKIVFEDEGGWDITMKSYDELVEAFKLQGALSEEVYLEAIENTNVLADMVEEFTMDTSFKYPKLVSDPEKTMKQFINEGVVKRGINLYLNYKEYIDRIRKEYEVYVFQGALDYLLLDKQIKDYGREHNIYAGCSRGSVAGSVIAYIVGITDIDPIKEGLNFERFMSLDRVSLADIDSDYEPSNRGLIRDYLYSIKGLHCADIVTFNTVAAKGSVREVCRALFDGTIPQRLQDKYEEEMISLGGASELTSRQMREYSEADYLTVSSFISENIDDRESEMRRLYPEVFEYVDIISGTVVSVGSHACGVVVSPFPLEDTMGLITLKDNPRPVTMMNMKEVDSLNYVKLDLLGLDNIEVINKTCEFAGIERLTPDNVVDDEEVWKAIANDTTGIFQWESKSASEYIKKLFSDSTISKIKEKNPNFRYMDLLSIGNGAIRPAGASYREQLANGEFRDNGHAALNDFLAPTLGYLVYQEQIIEFLNKFCGFTMGQADIVRRAFSKKIGTEEHIPKIKEGFIKTMEEKYNVCQVEAEELIVSFLQVIVDASDYLFSLNHAQAYSYIGYMCGYLREKHPLEFFTVSLNQFDNKMEKTKEIVAAMKERNIPIERATFGKSKGNYFMDKAAGIVYKGVKSIKYMNMEAADSLYELGVNWDYSKDFVDLVEENNIGKRHLEVLIKIGYFRNFDTVKNLLYYMELREKFKNKTFKKEQFSESQNAILSMFAGKETEKQFSEIDKKGLFKHIISLIGKGELSLFELAGYEIEYTGSVSAIDDTIDTEVFMVTSVNDKYTPTLKLYRYKDGSILEDIKVYKSFYKEGKQVQVGDTIYVSSLKESNRMKKVGEEWVKTDEINTNIQYYIVNRKKI